jgi:HK97 gp10 family phage protein
MALDPNRPVISLEGIKTTISAIGSLGSKVGSKVIIKATRAGCRVFLKAARRKVPQHRTGTLRRELTIKIKRKRGFIVGRVGARNRKTGKNNPAHYLHLIERGTKPHNIPGPITLHGRTYSNVAHPGSRPQRPVERAMNEMLITALSAYGAKLDEEVLKEAALIRAQNSGSTA